MLIARNQNLVERKQKRQKREKNIYKKETPTPSPRFTDTISQRCWPSFCKLRRDDRNIWTQHIATLLGATCCTRLATLLQGVAKCWVLKIELVRMSGRYIFARTWPNDHNNMQHPQMLHENFYQFQIWANSTQHVATCPNRVAKRTQRVAPNYVAICWVGMLRSFDRSFTVFGGLTLTLNSSL